MIKIGMIIGDRYEILEKIGTGGMSDVYKAKDHKLNRFVAVKVLKQEFSENANFVSKFRIEAQAAAGLMHPNIVNVYDVGEENGIYYIILPVEYCAMLYGGSVNIKSTQLSGIVFINSKQSPFINLDILFSYAFAYHIVYTLVKVNFL